MQDASVSTSTPSFLIKVFTSKFIRGLPVIWVIMENKSTHWEQLGFLMYSEFVSVFKH